MNIRMKLRIKFFIQILFFFFLFDILYDSLEINIERELIHNIVPRSLWISKQFRGIPCFKVTRKNPDVDVVIEKGR